MDADFRWRLAGANDGPPRLWTEEPRDGRRELPTVEYLHVEARRIVNAVPRASRLPFRYTINAYRGCSHACTYCFARPTHEYLGMNAGEDFERRIVVKVNAVARLRAELAAPDWAGDRIAMGTNTDPYQPAEGRYRLTRGIVETLGEHANPFSILTKSPMVLRDVDALVGAARRTWVRVDFSIGTLDPDVWRASEPGTAPPRRRLEALARLRDAGIDCGVLVAPVLPGLSDGPGQVEEVVEACLEAGADSVSPILLHLRPGVREHYLGWLRGHRPDLLPRHAGLYRGAYATAAARDELARRVDVVLARYGGRPPSPRGARREPAPAPPPPPRPEQLDLLAEPPAA
jgi:DNA repair photolyase